MKLDAPLGRASVGNPDIADIVVIQPTEIYVLGKDIGTTNVFLWDRDNRSIGSLNIEVTHDLGSLKSKLHQLLPDHSISVHSAQRSGGSDRHRARRDDHERRRAPRGRLSRSGADGEEGRAVRAGVELQAR